MEYILKVFREPLEAKGACIFSLQDEADEVVDFYRKFSGLSGRLLEGLVQALHTV